MKRTASDLELTQIFHSERGFITDSGVAAGCLLPGEPLQQTSPLCCSFHLPHGRNSCDYIIVRSGMDCVRFFVPGGWS